MAKLIYNADVHMVYPEPQDRDLRSYEHIVVCPFCHSSDISDGRPINLFPPFVCEGENGCGQLFDESELRAYFADPAGQTPQS